MRLDFLGLILTLTDHIIVRDKAFDASIGIRQLRLVTITFSLLFIFSLQSIIKQQQRSSINQSQYSSSSTVLSSSMNQVENSSLAPQDARRNDNSSLSPTHQQQSMQQQGIDIRQALDILSSRTPHDHNHMIIMMMIIHRMNIRHRHQEQGLGGCSNCCQQEGRELPDDVKQAATSGQVIDLFAAPTTAATAEGEQQQQQQQLQTIEEMKEQQKLKTEQNKKELVEKLHSITKLSDILRLVLKTQEDRVLTYQQYNATLQQVLTTNNLTLYPSGCVNATASFSVLSDTIIAIKDELIIRRRGR